MLEEFLDGVAGRSRRSCQRIGIIARTKPRRRFVDNLIESSGLEFHRWDDPILDTDTARAVRALLSRLDLAGLWASADPLAFLRDHAQFEIVQDFSVRTNLGEALSWCLDLLRDECKPAEIRSRIRVCDEHTLLNIAGVHLLTGHIGKGQQFDWVMVIGAEEGCLPDFRAETSAALTEEARILSVMVSRARHGVWLSYAQCVPSQKGRLFQKQPSRYWPALADHLVNLAPVNTWLDNADWAAIARR